MKYYLYNKNCRIFNLAPPFETSLAILNQTSMGFLTLSNGKWMFNEGSPDPNTLIYANGQSSNVIWSVAEKINGKIFWLKETGTLQAISAIQDDGSGNPSQASQFIRITPDNGQNAWILKASGGFLGFRQETDKNYYLYDLGTNNQEEAALFIVL